MILRKKHVPQFLNEVDVDGTPAGEEVEAPDYTTSGEPEAGETPPADDSTPQGAEPPAGDATGGGEEQGSYGDDIDYTEGSDQNTEGSGDPNTEGGEAPPEEENQVTADDARGMEQELFQDLTPDQIDLKHKELKNKYLELYNSTSNIVDRINELPTSDTTVASITFVAKKLAELRKMIADYMNDVYSTKSYMENAINYNRFLAALSGINKILDKINKDLVNNDDNEPDR